MASPDVKTFTDDNFQNEVLASGEPVLVDFWAAWCGPCRAIAPLVDQLASEYKGKLKVGKLDIDAHQNVPQKYGVMSIPTLLLFKNGQVADQIVGAVPKAKLDATRNGSPHRGAPPGVQLRQSRHRHPDARVQLHHRSRHHPAR